MDKQTIYTCESWEEFEQMYHEMASSKWEASSVTVYIHQEIDTE